jgi:deoxyribodipyrimidine photo-lyase
VSRAVVWFRRDLRLADHPALVRALESTDEVLPLVVLDPVLSTDERRPAVARYLAGLVALYWASDGALLVRRGNPAVVVRDVAADVGAATVHVSGESTPYGRNRDERVARQLADRNIELVETGSPYAVSPGRVRTGAGGGYQVFTPFYRAWREHGWRPPAPAPRRPRWLRGVESDELPAVDPGAAGAGEPAARRAWRRFLDEHLRDYDKLRDRPDLPATSRVSIPLKYGELHPRTLLADIAAHAAARSTGAAAFVRQLCWREFYADVLWHHPHSAWHDLRDELRDMRYADPVRASTGAHIDAWRAGRTGYPLVDAGMRQLLAEGWMHNRVRLVTASFLVKDLHVWWPVGARHFMDHLLDRDLASNNHGWQWVAGTGTDAAPYFRIFNPVSQGKKFDPGGDYVRRYVPELRHLAGGAVHEPWRAEDGYRHGYPRQIVDHAAERREALERYEATRRSTPSRSAVNEATRARRS